MAAGVNVADTVSTLPTNSGAVLHLGGSQPALLNPCLGIMNSDGVCAAGSRQKGQSLSDSPETQ